MIPYYHYFIQIYPKKQILNLIFFYYINRNKYDLLIYTGGLHEKGYHFLNSYTSY